MIGSVGSQTVAGAQAGEARSAGKRVDAVGLQAKAAVAVAREFGAEVPRNAQGLAASAAARGIDPASLLTARFAADDAATGQTAEPPVSPDDPGPGLTTIRAGDDPSPSIGAEKKWIVSEDPAVAPLLAKTKVSEPG